jgi:hypothetical protein
MVISHKYKYVFIQLDKTASTAIAKELCENYDANPILWKHARYKDFMLIANAEQKKYFKFSGIRNPLDSAVSLYYYWKNAQGIENKKDFKKYKFITGTNASFADYFKKYLSKNIFCEWKYQNFEKLDYVYKYENLDTEFAKILNLLEITQKNPLQKFNQTIDKKNFLEYYPKEIQGMARIVFSNAMKQFGYAFPDNWEKPTFKEKYIIRPYLYFLFFLQKIGRLIVDHPVLYLKFHKIKIQNENSHIS